MKSLIDKDALESYRARCLNPHTNPVTRGGAENDDIQQINSFKTINKKSWND